LTQYEWSKVPTEKVTEKFSRKIISGEKVMLTQCFLKKTVAAFQPVRMSSVRDQGPGGRICTPARDA
jgi:hypothetical protein